MNVYDFDNTIYRGDSTFDFCLFCLKRDPGLLRFLPGNFAAYLRYLTGSWSKTRMKEYFFRFFPAIPDMEAMLAEFWAVAAQNIKPWYRQQPDDVIISASPEFLLRPICDRLGIRHLLASRVDIRTGKYDGENCWGPEKVRRFYEKFPEGKIGEFYSDSRSDAPLAQLAQQAWFVEGDKIKKWQGGK